MKYNLKEKGITLVALVVTMIILLILAGVTINLVLSNNGLLKRAQEASNIMANATKDETKQFGELSNFVTKKSNTSAWDKTKKVNAPALKQGMTPVKFENGNIVETTTDDENWYDYDKQEWANAQTEDGSLWVWIPRYAYQVQYYSDADLTTPSSTKTKNGKMDIKFLINETDQYYVDDKNTEEAKRCKTEEEIVDTTKGYTVHPAFTNESSINYRNGGWDRELTGIWVAKCENLMRYRVTEMLLYYCLKKSLEKF